MMGRNVNSVEEFTNQENVLHMGRNVINTKKNHWANCYYTKKVHEASAAPSDDFVLEEVTTSKEKKATEAFVIVKINNKKVKAKLETGVEVNVIPLQIYKQIETDRLQMRKAATKLCGYGGTNIPAVEKITVKCEFCDA